MHFSNNAVCLDELVGHFHVPACLVDMREIEGNLPPQIQMIIRDTLKFLSGQCESHLVVMYGQVCEADLVQRSAQVVHALLTDSPEVHIPPEKGEALQHQCVTFGDKLL